MNSSKPLKALFELYVKDPSPLWTTVPLLGVVQLCTVRVFRSTSKHLVNTLTVVQGLDDTAGLVKASQHFGAWLEYKCLTSLPLTTPSKMWIWSRVPVKYVADAPSLLSTLPILENDEEKSPVIPTLLPSNTPSTYTVPSPEELSRENTIWCHSLSLIALEVQRRRLPPTEVHSFPLLFNQPQTVPPEPARPITPGEVPSVPPPIAEVFNHKDNDTDEPNTPAKFEVTDKYCLSWSLLPDVPNSKAVNRLPDTQLLLVILTKEAWTSFATSKAIVTDVVARAWKGSSCQSGPSSKFQWWRTSLDNAPIWVGALVGSGVSGIGTSVGASVGGKRLSSEILLEALACTDRKFDFIGSFSTADKGIWSPMIRPSVVFVLIPVTYSTTVTSNKRSEICILANNN